MWGVGIEILVQERSHHLGPIKRPHNAMMGSVTGHTGTSTGHWLLKAVRDLVGCCQYEQRASPSRWASCLTESEGSKWTGS